MVSFGIHSKITDMHEDLFEPRTRLNRGHYSVLSKTSSAALLFRNVFQK